MPNWCAGDLKIRGSSENIKRFLRDGLEVIDCCGEGMDVPHYFETGFGNVDIVARNGIVRIRDVHRGFIMEPFCYAVSERTLDVLCIPNVEFAWDIDVVELQGLAIKYSIDFKIYAFECGMQFNRDIEVLSHGEIVLERKIRITDYDWNCICPTRGG